ncbi:MAG TPA: Glu/Leu/Phe/Val dehydrogenase dimerization domain-containing protein [Myxococcota bacterium]|nr:Glu/Leu/Phe/Val dehydrogenase dimerization domain-containing protein [Myxococcota bacterium]
MAPTVYSQRLAAPGGGLEMIVAIDSTARGPALGGCRWKRYPDAASARRDALALAAAMTRKAALAGLALGGGKAVVAGDPGARTEADLLAFGEFVESLGGAYITAADMGTGEREMATIARRTSHVAGLPRALGGCGDPGPFTALGVELALEAALAHAGGALRGAHVAVQGVGSVGRELVLALRRAGARVTVADPSPAALAGLPRDVTVVAPDELARLRCDAFAPCGPAAVVDDALAEALECRVVCGAANNPLASRGVASVLESRGILYVPDFVANAGGLIHLAVALEGGDDAATRRKLRVIPENLERVLAHAKARGVDPASAAEELALAAVG